MKEITHRIKIFFKKSYPFCILLPIFILAGIIAYMSIINSFFISDDFSHINHLIINSPLGAFYKQCSAFYRPLVYFSLFIDYKIWGLNPAGYHITNILFHSLNSFFVFLLCILLSSNIPFKKNNAFIAALFSGLLFLLLPSHAEAVTWISDRGDIIATFFCLGSTLVYLFWRLNPNKLYLSVSLLLYLNALFSKESVTSFPLIILFYELYIYFKEQKKDRFISHLFPFSLFFITLIIYMIIRYIVTGRIVGGYGNAIHLNFNPLLITENFIAYTARIFLPPMYNIKLIFSVITAMAISVVLLAKRRPPSILYFLMIAFSISLLPVINLGANYLRDTQGERFIYFPSVFFLIFVAYLFYFLINHKVYFVIALVYLILMFSLSLHKVNKNWVQAGEISKNILSQIGKLESSDRLIFKALPDNINGAYIYRNGIQQAVHLFIGPDRFKTINVISLYDVFNKDDAVTVTKDKYAYGFQLSNPKACFRITDLNYVNNITCNSFSLDLKAINVNDKLLFYSAGKIITLNNKH